jgi:hypothetical protein
VSPIASPTTPEIANHAVDGPPSVDGPPPNAMTTESRKRTPATVDLKMLI